MKTDTELEQDGFTQSGRQRYSQTVGDFSDTLHQKAVLYADADKAPGMNREVTHDHVRSAAHAIATVGPRSPHSKSSVVCQVGEYVFTAMAGVGGGQLGQQWGIICFGAGLTAAVVLFVIRNVYLK